MVIVVNMKFRTEFDSLGKIKVPADKYWGACTQRSNKYFDIGDFLVRPIVIKSIAMIKKAAAIVNEKPNIKPDFPVSILKYPPFDRFKGEKLCISDPKPV